MKIIDWTLFRIPAVVFPVLVVVAGVVVSRFEPDHIVVSVLSSGVLCFFHMVVGYIVLESAFKGTPTTLLKRVLGGMALRLVVMLLVFGLLLFAGVVDETWLLLSLLVWYAIALVFEISALQKKVSLRQQSS